MDWPGFAAHRLVGDLFAQVAGSGPAVLLLHGFPETHLMWRDVAARLAERFTVIAADLPGYGASARTDDQSKRAMAAAFARALAALGHDRFAVAGHDRGGRVAYRLALDCPERITHLVVLDIVPVETAWTRADDRFALAYWPWGLLAQDAPLPEHILTHSAAVIVDAALGGWGSPAAAFPATVRDAYVQAVAANALAICDEYRAGAGTDREHDRIDRAVGRRIACPTLALWSGDGPLADWYEADGGPLALWREWASDLRGEAVAGGHFFVEEQPEATSRRLIDFLTA